MLCVLTRVDTTYVFAEKKDKCYIDVSFYLEVLQYIRTYTPRDTSVVQLFDFGWKYPSLHLLIFMVRFL